MAVWALSVLRLLTPDLWRGLLAAVAAHGDPSELDEVSEASARDWASNRSICMHGLALAHTHRAAESTGRGVIRRHAHPSW